MKMLEDYARVCWDFDDTLIGHHNSHLFWQYIIDNPYDQEHHIITFRSGGMQKLILRDLDAYGSGLSRSHFKAFWSIPHKLWVEFHEIEDPSKYDGDHPYLHWKGEICRALEASVLIDDDTRNVIKGCEAHGITLFHPDELFHE